MNPKLREMPSWTKVEAAQEAIRKHRGPDGNREALAAAQKALGDAYEDCRDELGGAADTGTDPDPDAAPAETSASDNEPTKVEKPPSASKKRTGGKKTTSSRPKSSRRSRSKD